MCSRNSDADGADDRDTHDGDVKSTTNGNHLHWMKENQTMLGNDSSDEVELME